MKFGTPIQIWNSATLSMVGVEGVQCRGPQGDTPKPNYPPPSVLLHRTCISSTGCPMAEKFYGELTTIDNF